MAKRDCLNADAIIARLMEINQPDALVVTEVDLNGDILVGMAVRVVRWDGFHRRITISGVMDADDWKQLEAQYPTPRGIIHGKD